MLALRTILVPVDFNDTSHHALAYAQELARMFGAQLHVLHVLEDAFALPAGTEGTLSAFPRLAREAEDDARERLAALVTARLPDTVVTVVIGAPAAAIIAHAERLQASMIVMGTHGQSANPPGDLGSVAAQVVRTAPCPVLTVRNQPGGSIVLAEAAAELGEPKPLPS